MTSPDPSSRIQSGTVTPLHPRPGAAAAESPTNRPDDFFFIGKSRNYIKEGQKAALHTKGILNSPQGQKTKPRTPHQPLRDRYPLQEA